MRCTQTKMKTLTVKEVKQPEREKVRFQDAHVLLC